MRSRPSDADLRLVARLADEGVTISPTQLERWRGHGLIARAQVERDSFGGSRILDHPDDVFDACRFLAGVTHQGRPWQYSAIELFGAGGELPTEALRRAAAFLIDRQVRGFRRAWRLAEPGAEPGGKNDFRRVADVATKAAEHAGRDLRRTVRIHIASVHPQLSAPQLREATERALIWWIADVNAPTSLGDEQRTLARHGLDEPLDPLTDEVFPLPSERAACIATITWEEARLARRSYELEESPLLEEQGALDLATWRVTAWRMHHHFDHPERPLSDLELSNMRDDIEQAHGQSEDNPSKASNSDDPQSEDE
jgi:hypothetical protein